MGVLNVTPDSFSDGGRFRDAGAAVARAEEMIAEGADIIDVGGESTRPGSEPVSAEEELRRVLPVVERLTQSAAVAVSVDTTKSEVARAALDAGADIINDISALRFDYRVADECARAGAGLVLMHMRGTPATMQRTPFAADVFADVSHGLRAGVAMAERRGVRRAQLAVDPGIGFGKSVAQNVELIARLDRLAREFPDLALVVGTSRKSFVGKLLGDAPVSQRLHGTMASVTAAILRGAHVVRVHDVRAAVETARVADAIRRAGSS
jgi:dihydropteroate synthase